MLTSRHLILLTSHSRGSTSSKDLGYILISSLTAVSEAQRCPSEPVRLIRVYNNYISQTACSPNANRTISTSLSTPKTNSCTSSFATKKSTKSPINRSSSASHQPPFSFSPSPSTTSSQSQAYRPSLSSTINQVPALVSLIPPALSTSLSNRICSLPSTYSINSKTSIRIIDAIFSPKATSNSQATPFSNPMPKYVPPTSLTQT